MASVFTGDLEHRKGMVGVKVIKETEVTGVLAVSSVWSRVETKCSTEMRQQVLNHSYFLTTDSFFLITEP